MVITSELRLVTCAVALFLFARGTMVQPTQSDYYTIESVAIPEGIVLEVGGLAFLPGGALAAATRRGDV